MKETHPIRMNIELDLAVKLAPIMRKENITWLQVVEEALELLIEDRKDRGSND